MKLISLSCPNCNATIQVNSELKQGVCNYCGHQFLIDDESVNVNLNIQNPRELGKEFELGRRNAIGGNTELTERLRNLIEPFSVYKAIGDEINKLDSKLNKYKTYMIISFGIAFWCFFASIYQFTMNSSIESFLVVIFFTAIPCGIGILFLYLYRQNNQRKKDQLVRLNQQIDLLNQLGAGIIPPDYRYYDAVVFIYNALLNQRAMTMQEAVIQYENSKPRMYRQ